MNKTRPSDNIKQNCENIKFTAHFLYASWRALSDLTNHK